MNGKSRVRDRGRGEGYVGRRVNEGMRKKSVSMKKRRLIE